MPEEAVLRRLVVVGRNLQGSVGAHGFGAGGQLDRLAGRVGAGTGEHGHALARFLHHDLDNSDVLLVAQGGRFARGSHGNQSVDAGADLLVDQAAQGLFVHAIVAQGRDQRGNDSFEHVVQT